MTAFALEPIEKAPREELRRLQLERLQWSLTHAYEHVPHFRRKFDAAGVKPSDCRSLADLQRFPFTTKADLRETYPFGMFAVPMERIVRIHASSGTTGKPTVVGYTARDIDTWSTLMARSIRAAGARPGEKVHVAYGYGLFTGGLGAHYGAERLGLAVIPLGGGMTERQVQLIADFEPEIIMVTPSYMLAIADEMARQGLDPKASSLRLGIFGAEPWSNEMRRSIEARVGLEALDLYGLSEVMGPGVAQECSETKDGLTLWEDHFYPEIVDPESGEPLPDGQKGELVFTSLRQCFSVTDRGAAAEDSGPQPALCARSLHGRTAGPPGSRGRRQAGGGKGPRAQHQGIHRHQRRGTHRCRRALHRQGEARHRQAS